MTGSFGPIRVLPAVRAQVDRAALEPEAELADFLDHVGKLIEHTSQYTADPDIAALL
ncbi:hypothetical protein [Frankia gtarii]|uniref:hypothetical protein n=1 Tax=Frankia gtarii TaxID=2950102 RepID=UPI0021BF8617|nr:hypothetical protein [Frankia gtarii]